MYNGMLLLNILINNKICIFIHCEERGCYHDYQLTLSNITHDESAFFSQNVQFSVPLQDFSQIKYYFLESMTYLSFIRVLDISKYSRRAS